VDKAVNYILSVVKRVVRIIFLLSILGLLILAGDAYKVFISVNIPDSFEDGFIIPSVEDKSRKFNAVDKYRGITLVPVIAKVFEAALNFMCQS
jgi:hypothetical protein